MKPFITTNPEYNKPCKAKCDKCGVVFIREPWSGVYSKGGIPVALCDSCALEELKAGRISEVLF